MRRLTCLFGTNLLLAASFCLFPNNVCWAQEQQDWDWVNKHFNDVLDEFLPIEQRLGEPLGFRTHRDLYTDVLEYSVIFNRDWRDKRIDVVIRIADTISLYDQMMALHRKNHTESIESIKKQLKVKQWHLSDSTCPVVRTLYEDFYKLELSMLSSEDRADQAKGIVTVTVHPTIYIFKAFISGGHMELVLTEQEHAFIRWANEARRRLETCVSKVTNSTRRK